MVPCGLKMRTSTIAKRDDPAFRLRLPKDVLRAISARAKKNGRSRNSEIVVVLAQVISEEKAKATDPQASR